MSGKVLSISIVVLLLCIAFGAGAWYVNMRYSRIARQLRYAEKDLMVRLVEDFAQSSKPLHKNAVKMLTRTLRFLKGRNRLEKPYFTGIWLTRVERPIPHRTGGFVTDRTDLELRLWWLEDGFHTKGLKAKITTPEGTEQIIELPVYGHCMTEYWDDDAAEWYKKTALRDEGIGITPGKEWKLEQAKPRKDWLVEAVKKMYGVPSEGPPDISRLPKEVVIPAEALKNPILICVYDDKGNESNWVELFVDEEVPLSL